MKRISSFTNSLIIYFIIDFDLGIGISKQYLFKCHSLMGENNMQKDNDSQMWLRAGRPEETVMGAERKASDRRSFSGLLKDEKTFPGRRLISTMICNTLIGYIASFYTIRLQIGYKDSVLKWQ